MICRSNSVALTQFSDIWIIHRNVGLKCFFIYLMFVIIIRFSYIYYCKLSTECATEKIFIGQ